MAALSSIVTSSIQTYVDQLGYNKFEREIVLQSRIASLVQTLDGIKLSRTINVITSTPQWQSASCKLFQPQGTQSWFQRTLTVCPIEQEWAVCYNGVGSLEQIWVGMNLPKGSYYDSGKILPDTFAEVFVADIMDKIADGIEYVLFQGSQTGGTFSGSLSQYGFNNYGQYQSFCQGWLDILVNTSASQSVVFYNGTASGPLQVNTSNVLTLNSAFSVVDQLVNQQMQALPNLAAEKDMYLFMNYANFQAYLSSLRNLNYYHFSPLDLVGMSSIKHPGSNNVTIQAVEGLIGSNYMLMTYGRNLYIGYDAEGEEKQMQVWYEPLYNSTLLRPMWKFGATIAYPQYCIVYTGN